MLHKYLAKLIALSLLFASTVTTSVIADETANETIMVPVRAYYIYHEKLGSVSVSTDQQSLYDQLLAVNQIWVQAGIQFYFQEQRFSQPSDLGRFEYNMGRDKEMWAVTSVCPRTRKGIKGIDFCIVGQLKSNNGSYLTHVNIRNKKTGRYEKPKLGRKDSHAPIIVVPVKSGTRTTPNAIRIAALLGNALNVKSYGNKEEGMYLMGWLPNDVYNGNDYSGIKLKPDEIAKAREYALKIAQDPPS